MEPLQQQLANIKATLQNLSEQDKETAFSFLQQIVAECKPADALTEPQGVCQPADTPTVPQAVCQPVEIPTVPQDVCQPAETPTEINFSSSLQGDDRHKAGDHSALTEFDQNQPSAGQQEDLSNVCESDVNKAGSHEIGSIQLTSSQNNQYAILDHDYHASVTDVGSGHEMIKDVSGKEKDANTDAAADDGLLLGDADTAGVAGAQIPVQREENISSLVNAVFEVSSLVDAVPDGSGEQQKTFQQSAGKTDPESEAALKSNGNDDSVLENTDTKSGSECLKQGEGQNDPMSAGTNNQTDSSTDLEKPVDTKGSQQIKNLTVDEKKYATEKVTRKRGRPPKKSKTVNKNKQSKLERSKESPNLKRKSAEKIDESLTKQKTTPNRPSQSYEDSLEIVKGLMETSKSDNNEAEDEMVVSEDDQEQKGDSPARAKHSKRFTGIKSKPGGRGKQKVRTFKCPICPQTFSHGRPFKRHLVVHDSGPCCCRVCCKEFESFSACILHVCDLAISKAVLDCDFCEEKFPSFNQLRLHVKEQHQVNSLPQYFCKDCGKGFVKKISLHQHLGVHFPTKHVCLKCGKVLDTQEAYSQHMNLHKQGSQYHCAECDESFQKQQQYQRHLEAHKKYVCDLCHTTFAQKKLYLKHARIAHDLKTKPESKNYACETCEKTFTRPGQLKVHLRIHTGERPHECKVCVMTFRTNKALLKHERTNSHLMKAGETPRGKDYLCSECGRAYSRQSGLHRHMRYHTGVRPYKCPHCDYACKEHSNLKRHIALHFSERQFVCDICGAAFHAKKILETHMIYKHSEGKDHHCDECSKSFKTLSALKRHKKCHTGEKLFKCNCGASFNRGCNLRRHMRAVHGTEEGIPPVKRVPLLDVPPEDAYKLKYRRKGSTKSKEKAEKTLKDEAKMQTFQFDVNSTCSGPIQVQVYEHYKPESSVIPVISYQHQVAAAAPGEADASLSHQVAKYEAPVQHQIIYTNDIITTSNSLLDLHQANVSMTFI